MANPFTPGRDFVLTNGDLDFSTGDLAFTNGAEAVAQAIRLRISLWVGEWFRNVEAGVPYSQEILGFKPTTQRLYAIFRTIIAGTFGVVEILQLDVDLAANRTLTVTWQVRTEYGLVDGTETF